MNEVTKIELITLVDDDGNIVGIEANYPIFARETKFGFQVQCPVFKTIGYSPNSIEEAISDHDRDLDVFFKVHIKRKTLRTTLTSFGWNYSDHHYSSNLSPFLQQEPQFKNRRVLA